VAYEGKGDQGIAKALRAKAVDFNQLPTVNSVLVRMKAGRPKA